MQSYVCLLRGINVGGHRIIKMADLRELLKKEGFEQVKTYIQSGNILLQSKETDTEQLAEQIATAIQQEFGFEVPTLVITPDTLERVVQHNPFLEEAEELKTLHVTFLQKQPSKDQLEGLAQMDFTPDKMAVHPDYVYLFCPGPYHKTKLSNAFFEKELGTSATTRNWKTVLKLQEMLQED